MDFEIVPAPRILVRGSTNDAKNTGRASRRQIIPSRTIADFAAKGHLNMESISVIAISIRLEPVCPALVRMSTKALFPTYMMREIGEVRPMVFYDRKNSVKFLGTLRGSGGLRIGDAETIIGPINYQIDRFSAGARHYAEGQIHGDARHLTDAFEAGAARIALPGGKSIDIVVADPVGEGGADVTIRDATALT